MAQTKLNILPLPTFGQLGVNFAERDVEGFETEEISISPADDRYILQFNYSDSTDRETVLRIAKDAKVKLVQVFGGTDRTVSKLSAVLDDSAELELIQLYIGGRDTVSDIAVALDGRRSAFRAHIGFDLAQEDKLDINLNAVHTGKKSSSDIAVRGVLSDRSEKTFKGTIDFRNGSAGAKGSEQEEVLLMSEKVRNKTVPVILCAEEDVAGNHGATVGRIDERHIFYMRSRGIPEEKIYELMARSKLMQIIGRIGDEPTESRIFRALDWSDDNE